ncbi:MAG: hypothetical protein ACOH18_05610 [Candidatus Saccharimonadaceae bacterium]
MSFFGDLVAATGKKLNLPELGISEKFGSGGVANVGTYGAIVDKGASTVAGVVNPGSSQLKTVSAPTVTPPDISGGNGGGAGGGSTAYDPVAVASARKAAADNAKKAQLKGEGISSLDQLYALYDQIVNQIKTVGGDAIGRVNKDFDGKVADQVTDMNNGMYDTDAAAAAGNLADSSWRSFDRTKVRNAADANIKTLNGARESAAGEIGQNVATDEAKYRADQAGIARTKNLLGSSDDLTEIQNTANTLDATKRGVTADQAKYSTTGEFAQKANSIGKYDTSVLESTLASVVANASASPAAKAGAVNDLLTGAQIDDGEKERLKNKYTQSV